MKNTMLMAILCVSAVGCSKDETDYAYIATQKSIEQTASLMVSVTMSEKIGRDLIFLCLVGPLDEFYPQADGRYFGQMECNTGLGSTDKKERLKIVVRFDNGSIDRRGQPYFDVREMRPVITH